MPTDISRNKDIQGKVMERKSLRLEQLQKIFDEAPSSTVVVSTQRCKIMKKITDHLLIWPVTFLLKLNSFRKSKTVPIFLFLSYPL